MFDQHQNFQDAILKRKARIEEIQLILARPSSKGHATGSRRRLIEERLRLERSLAELEAEDARFLSQRKLRNVGPTATFGGVVSTTPSGFEPPPQEAGDHIAVADSPPESLITVKQAAAAHAWEEIDHSLVKLKLADVAEEFRERLEADERHIRFENRHNANTDAASYLILRMKEQNTEEWAQRTYQTYCEVWQIQGRTKSASFVRAVFIRAIVPLIHARAGAIAGEFERFAKCTAFPSELCKATVGSFRLKMQRLEDRWRRRLEAEAKECEHAERRSSQSTRDQSNFTKASKSETTERTPREVATINHGTPVPGALLSKYRSELKRGILIQLTQNPNATDNEICRGLDADGTVELPASWKARPEDRLFARAYRDPHRKRRIEIAISKIRADLRKSGLLAPR